MDSILFMRSVSKRPKPMSAMKDYSAIEIQDTEDANRKLNLVRVANGGNLIHHKCLIPSSIAPLALPITLIAEIQTVMKKQFGAIPGIKKQDGRNVNPWICTIPLNGKAIWINVSMEVTNSYRVATPLSRALNSASPKPGANLLISSSRVVLAMQKMKVQVRNSVIKVALATMICLTEMVRSM